MDDPVDLARIGITSRAYEAGDLDAVIGLARACTLAATPRKGYAHPGDVVWREHGPRPSEPDREDACVWLDGAGPAAHATFEGPAHLEFLVRPGSAAALVEAIVAWGEERRQAHGATAEQPLATPVLASDGERAAILGRLGFRPGRAAGTQFAYDLGRPLPAALLPARARLRHATDADVEARAELHRAAWVVWGPSSATAENYARMRRAPLYDERLDIVVERQGQLVSYCVCWADAGSGTGLFEPVGTRRDFTGEGFARAVLAEGLLRLRARGLHTAYVGTAAVNTRALALYSTFGFREVDTLTLWERGAW